MLLADFYAQQLKRQNAQRITLISGEPIRLHTAQGEQVSKSPIGHTQVMQLIEEIATLNQLSSLRQDSSLSMDYAPGKLQIEVQVRSDAQWQVEMRPLGVVTERPQPVAASAAPQAEKVSGLGSSLPTPAPQPVSRPNDKPSAQPSVSVSVKTGEEPRLNHYLRKMIERGASDLHMSSEVAPLARVHGEIHPLEDDTPLSSAELRSILMEVAPEDNIAEFDSEFDTDFAHTIPGLARFRANYFMDRHGIGAVFRQIPFEILSPDVLGIPKEVLDLCWLSKGLVLVTGPTGSGKSTTLATLIDYVNENRSDHVITIEDPIEFVHQNKNCLVNQREVGTHTKSFKKALRAALREDPDIVLVGEMRDLETISIAVETAETGHLVFGTLHTTTAPSTVDRIIDQFPAAQQGQIRAMLSESLKGVISQVLCKKSSGGRAAAYEVLIANSAISNLIREGKTFQLASMMQTGKNQGMRTMNDSLVQLVKSGDVEAKEAYIKAVDKQGLKMMFQQSGIRLDLGDKEE